jgi:hypothetical protein
MDPETVSILEALRRLDSVDVRVKPIEISSVQVSDSSSSMEPESFDPLEAEHRARAFLLAAGAIISLETRIIPESAQEARIEDIVFGGVDRDRTVSFLLQLNSREVRQITEGTQEYPYAMPWEDFVHWMRR